MNSSLQDFSDYFIEQAPQWTVHERIAPFSRRTTCIDWHPTYMDVLAVSSHGGDIYVWNLHDKLKEIMHQGVRWNLLYCCDFGNLCTSIDLIYLCSMSI